MVKQDQDNTVNSAFKVNFKSCEDQFTGWAITLTQGLIILVF